MDLTELSDRAEIADLICRYSRAIDTRSWDDLDGLFAPGATIDYTETGGIRGDLGTVKSYLAEIMTTFSATQHMMGLPAIELDGDRAMAVTPCHNPLVMAGEGDGGSRGGRLLLCWLWYHEEFVRTPEGWRIADLREERCHMQMVPRADPIY